VGRLSVSAARLLCRQLPDRAIVLMPRLDHRRGRIEQNWATANLIALSPSFPAFTDSKRRSLRVLSCGNPGNEELNRRLEELGVPYRAVWQQ
jgi:hypothetical protein